MRKLLAALTLLLLAVACNTSNTVVDNPFTISPTSINFTAQDTKARKVTVNTDAPWEAKPSDDWVKVTLNEDGKSFNVEVAPNVVDGGTTELRSSSVVVTTAANRATVVIKQAGDETNLYLTLLRNVKDNTLRDLNVKSCVSTATSCLSTIKADGSFPDINYKETGLTWTPRTHWSRLQSMTAAYVAPESTLKGDEALYNAIVNAVRFWYTENPKGDNWWDNEIGWPQYAGPALCLMRFGQKTLPEDLEQQMTSRILSLSRGPQKQTGANKQDVALVWFYTSILDQNRENLDLSVSESYQPMELTTGEGIQHDFSFQQHGTQLYMAGYGAVLVTAYLKFANYVKDTQVENKTLSAAISNFVRTGYVPLHRSSYILFSSGGRGHVSRPGAVNNKSFASSLVKMAEIDTENADFFTKASERIGGTKSADYGVEPMHYHFWRTDYAIHQRPSYTMDFRTASTRTSRCENGNTENLKGYFLCEGCSQVVVDGDEYYNIFPAWNWTHIPGTTVPNVATIPLTKAWGVAGQSRFTGGVSDGTYGCATYQYTDNTNGVQASANKSWFCFDNEIVCLGSSITSRNTEEMHTTVNQCIMKTGATAELADGSTAAISGGDQNFTSLRWLCCDKVCYHFPENAAITVNTAQRQGNWYNINNLQTGSVSQNIFLAYINHGSTPSSGKYAYYVLPARQSIADAKTALDRINYLREDKVHAVYNGNLKMLQAVFFDKGTATFGDLSVEAAAPCCLMITDIGSAPKLYVCDPSYSRTSVTLQVTLPGQSAKPVAASFKTKLEEKGTTVMVAL